MKGIILWSIVLLLIFTSGIILAKGETEEVGRKQQLILVSGSFAQNNMTGAGMGTGRNLVEELLKRKTLN